MSSAIITSLQVISVVIVGIILLVLANTIVMSVRERTREYAVLKTLGFSGRQLAGFVLGEALVISLSGGVLGLLLTFPIVKGFAKALPTFFPVINVAPLTMALGIGAALLAGPAASPRRSQSAAWRSSYSCSPACSCSPAAWKRPSSRQAHPTT